MTGRSGIRRRLLTILVAATAITAAAAVPATGPAYGTTASNGKSPRLVGIDSLSAADQARQRDQEPLLNLNNRVYDLASTSYDAQFAGAELDVQHHALVVYWTGTVPAALSGLRAEAAKSGRTLAIKPARFSRKQLMAAADQVMPTGEMTAKVELAVDGSGITIAAADLPAAARGTRSATPAESRLMQRIAATRSQKGVPISIAAAPAFTPQFDDTRHADNSPYWAGAGIKRTLSPNAYDCTSGFSMAAGGSRYTLTAAHCPDYRNNVQFNNGAGVRMGQSAFIDWFYGGPTSYDLGLISLDSDKTNAPYIFVDEDSSAGAIPVAGYASGGIPANGNYCVHGMAAVNCNLWSGGTVRMCSGGICVYTIAMSALNSNYIIYCHGDSGGPIYYWSGGSVIAAGVVSWGNNELGPCSLTGGVSVVATAVNTVPGLRVVTTSAP
jgi:hypothetical protein